MASPDSMIIDGNEYTWDDEVYRDNNKAKPRPAVICAGAEEYM